MNSHHRSISMAQCCRLLARSIALLMALFLAVQMPAAGVAPGLLPAPDAGEPPPDQVQTGSGSLAFITFYYSNRLVVIDRTLRSVIETIEMKDLGCNNISQIELDPPGERLYILCRYSANLIVLDAADRSLVYSLDNITGNEIIFNREGSLAYISYFGTAGNGIKIFDVASRAIVNTISTGDLKVVSLAIHPTRDVLYAAGEPNFWSGGFLAIDTITNEITASIDMSKPLKDVEPSPDGQWVYTASDGGGIAIIDAAENIIEDIIPFNYWLGEIQPSKEGKWLYAKSGHYISIIDLEERVFDPDHGYPGNAWGEMKLDCRGDELWSLGSRFQAPSVSIYPTWKGSASYYLEFPDETSLPGQVELTPKRCLALTPPDPYQEADPGTTLQYNETLINRTGLTDTFRLTLGPSSWPASLSTSEIGPLVDGEAATFTVTVDIPHSARPDETSSVLVTASSQTSPLPYTAEALLKSRRYYPPYTFLPVLKVPCRPDYADDFSDPSSGWPVADDGKVSVGYKSNEFRILLRNKRLSAMVWPGYKIQQFAVTFDARSLGALTNSYGLAYGIRTNLSEFSTFEIFRDGWWAIYWYYPDNVSLISYGQSDAIKPGPYTNKIRLQGDGLRLNAYVNGQLLTTVEDHSPDQNNFIGLLAFSYAEPNVDIRFDNFNVYPFEWAACLDYGYIPEPIPSGPIGESLTGPDEALKPPAFLKKSPMDGEAIREFLRQGQADWDD